MTIGILPEISLALCLATETTGLGLGLWEFFEEELRTHKFGDENTNMLSWLKKRFHKWKNNLMKQYGTLYQTPKKTQKRNVRKKRKRKSRINA